MAINFTDSPSNGDTQTINGRTYTYNSTKNKWDTTATEVTGPSATVYANVNALPGTATTGDQAFVSGTNRLYIWNGSGWYNIALINNTPTWTTQPNSSYVLATDGTATTVTIVATDPEGLPITYSIASDTSGSIATVTQGTGANVNTFTITPSTSNTDVGTFSLTFRASDGINVASAISSFTLAFQVTNSNYTTALITTSGSAGGNTTFTDSSSNSHTITANGDAHQTTFSPYRHGGYSTYFDGTDDYITAPSNTSFDFGTGNFTIETWINIPDVTSTWLAFISRGYAQNGGWRLYKNTGDNNLRFYYTDSGTTSYIEASTTGLTNNTWHHIAVVRNSSTTKIYVDGVEKGSGTISTSLNPGSYAVEVGSGVVTSSFPITGYMTDVRIVKGTAVYTSAFTPPTERLTAITYTELLTCHLPYIADGSTNDHTITVNGNTHTQPFAPYDAQEYSASSHGGSARFDGSGDYLTMADDASIDLSTGDFTLEAWIYLESTSGNQLIVDRYTSGNNGSFQFYYRSTGNSIAFWTAADSIVAQDPSSSTIKANTWHHVVATRESGVVKIYVDGSQVATGSCTTNFDSTLTLAIGAQISTSTNYLAGNISDVRIVKGTAVYTSDFTPPTAPLTAITNTSLLLQSTDAGIIDKSQTAESVQLFGDTKSATDQTKYLSSSIYFDGNGDYLKVPSSGNFLAQGAWTQEMWVRLAGTGTGQQIGPAFGGGAGAWNSSNGHQWLVFTHSSGFLVQYYGTNNSHNTITIASSAPFTANTWHHWAISWDGTTLRFFVDGTLEHSTTSFTPNTMTATHTELGRMPDNSYYSQAHYSDVRITKGLARYTSNFTAPAAALQG